MNLRCFCGNLFDEQAMKSFHYKTCAQFKNKFKDVDKKIGISIKHFVENLKRDETINGLFLLEFFLKRYISLVEEIIQKNNTEEKLTFNVVKNEVNKTAEVIKDLGMQKYSSSKLDKLKHSNRRQSPSLKKSMKTGLEEITEANEEKDNTKKKIYEYCKKVYQKDSNFDENLVKVMSYSLSSLTSRDCFLIISKNNQNDKIITSVDDKTEFYGIKYNDTNFLVLLY